jgi:hypothetical protein
MADSGVNAQQGIENPTRFHKEPTRLGPILQTKNVLKVRAVSRALAPVVDQGV